MNQKERRAAAKARGPGTPKDPGSAAANTKLKTAISHHQAGRLAEARRLYVETLSQEPNNVVALHLLGVITYQEGDACQATALIGKAIALRPKYAAAHNNLGNVLRDEGRLEEAVAAYHIGSATGASCTMSIRRPAYSRPWTFDREEVRTDNAPELEEG